MHAALALPFLREAGQCMKRTRGKLLGGLGLTDGARLNKWVARRRPLVAWWVEREQEISFARTFPMIETSTAGILRVSNRHSTMIRSYNCTRTKAIPEDKQASICGPWNTDEYSKCCCTDYMQGFKSTLPDLIAS